MIVNKLDKSQMRRYGKLMLVLVLVLCYKEDDRSAALTSKSASIDDVILRRKLLPGGVERTYERNL